MISAVVLTKNEEKNIKACFESISWCDEIIVIDDLSSDKTVEIAKKLGAKVYSRELKGDFAAQRNYGLEKVTGDWILFVDADERVSDQLAFEIPAITTGSTLNGFTISRVDEMWGKKLLHGETGTIKLLRLGRKNTGRWIGTVHERWEIDGRKGECKNALLHFPHPSLKEFLEEIHHYTDLRAEELYAQKVTVSKWQIVIYPLAKFLQNYFLKRGFLDGTAGIVHALLMSFHSFLVRGKLWILWRKKR